MPLLSASALSAVTLWATQSKNYDNVRKGINI